MVEIKDNVDYEDTLKELKALEEQTKEMQKVLKVSKNIKTRGFRIETWKTRLK